MLTICSCLFHGCLQCQSYACVLDVGLCCCLLLISVAIWTSCWQYFSMIKPSFYSNKDTMLNLAFHTWNLGFISCHLMPYGGRILLLKLEENHCIFVFAWH
jgi:hypothetical protein